MYAAENGQCFFDVCEKYEEEPGEESGEGKKDVQ